MTNRLPLEREINHTNSINIIHLNLHGYKEDIVRRSKLFEMPNIFYTRYPEGEGVIHLVCMQNCLKNSHLLPPDMHTYVYVSDKTSVFWKMLHTYWKDNDKQNLLQIKAEDWILPPLLSQISRIPWLLLSGWLNFFRADNSS